MIGSFLELGFRHIVDPRALDHVLFLLALAAIYRPRDWRAVLLVASAFTVGHSLTLALAATGTVVPPAPVIEFLIPLTIVATGVANITHGAAVGSRTVRLRPWLAGVFGLVHGAGFAGYLRGMFVGDPVGPLLGFNLGVELGQLVILAAAFASLVLCDAALARVTRVLEPVRLRSLMVSGAVTAVALVWSAERAPWW